MVGLLLESGLSPAVSNLNPVHRAMKLLVCMKGESKKFARLLAGASWGGEARKLY